MKTAKAKQEVKSTTISSTSLNTAIVCDVAPVVSGSVSETQLNSAKEGDDLNDARWFDHDIDIDENLDLDENINDRQIIDPDDLDVEDDGDEADEDDDDEECNSNSSLLSASRSAPSHSPARLLQHINENGGSASGGIGVGAGVGGRQLSLSLSDLPQSCGVEDLMNGGDEEDEDAEDDEEMNTTSKNMNTNAEEAESAADLLCVQKCGYKVVEESTAAAAAAGDDTDKENCQVDVKDVKFNGGLTTTGKLANKRIQTTSSGTVLCAKT